MTVRRYKPEDFDQVRTWLESRESHVFHPNILPDTGFIVDDIAALFIYKTDSDICYLENLVSNPEVEASARDEAISELIDTCLQEARKMEFKFVMSVTDVPIIIQRALLKGAKVQTNKVLLTKQLY